VTRQSPGRLVAVSFTVAIAATAAAAVANAIRSSASTPPGFDPEAVPPREAPTWFRDFVTHRWNPMVERMGLVGGRRSRWAALEHVGRTSGTRYATPVYPHLAGDQVFIALPYGVDVNWVRNVRAAGHCRMTYEGLRFELDEPAVVTAADRPDLPPRLRAMAERRGNRYLRLHLLEIRPDVPEAALNGEQAAPAVPAT
jgi:deazaflavin-dependent oxidoreductase (nitroreductase family)